jgi:two-component system OmpR family sensor kinase
MGALVEDLLTLARLDQSRDLVHVPVNLTELVTEADASAKAAGPDHPVTLDLPEEAFVLGDAGKIHQVVANLLANARIHTPVGTPIAVSIESNDEGTSISIADSGPGLSQEDQARIFERFYRADPSRNRAKEEGSGLGLSIVDAVMKAHGGKVSVTSKLGEGATFTVFFPLAAS